MTEKLRYITLFKEEPNGTYELLIQLSGGGELCRIEPNVTVRQLAWTLRILADRLEENANKRDNPEVVSPLPIKDQIRIMEGHINSPYANFTLMERMAYMADVFDDDPEYSKEARDIVRSNLAKGAKDE